MEDHDRIVKEIEDFVSRFEAEIDARLKESGASHMIWVNAPEIDDEGITTKGNCASQADCGGNRCKPKVDICVARVCVKRHLCGVNCQVGNDCGVKYCHGRCVSGRT